MKRWLLLFLAGFLICCSSKSETKPERHLYFTSNFPSSVYWEIMVTFESKSGMFWCKDLSMGQGGLVQKVKYEHYQLKNSDDTLKVPLFWSKTNFCDWEMTDLSIRPDGRLIAILGIYLKDKSQFLDQSKPLIPVPESLTYQCKMDAEDRYLNCKVENKESNEDFLIPDTAQSIHFRVDLKGF